MKKVVICMLQKFRKSPFFMRRPVPVLQGVSRHWTPENLAKSQALYKHELDTWKFSKCLIS